MPLDSPPALRGVHLQPPLEPLSKHALRHTHMSHNPGGVDFPDYSIASLVSNLETGTAYLLIPTLFAVLVNRPGDPWKPRRVTPH